MRFIFRGRRSIWWVWTMTLVTPRIVNNVSCVKRINDECHFSWQAQYLVKCKCHFSWQAQYLVKCKCHFSWQAQYSVKFGMIAGARNVIFQYKMLVVGVKGNLGCEAGCGLTVSCSDHGRVMVGSAAHWKWRFIRFQQISLRFWTVIFRGRRSIWWVWTMTHVAPRIVNNVSFVSRINHEIHFSWQAQYLVSLDYDTCYSAHCK